MGLEESWVFDQDECGVDLIAPVLTVISSSVEHARFKYSMFTFATCLCIHTLYGGDNL